MSKSNFRRFFCSGILNNLFFSYTLILPVVFSAGANQILTLHINVEIDTIKDQMKSLGPLFIL